MSNCSTCMNFVPECVFGCYCNMLKRPIAYDEINGNWFYVSFGWRKLEGSHVIALKNCVPYQIENRQYIREKIVIHNCQNWRTVCVETYPNLY